MILQSIENYGNGSDRDGETAAVIATATAVREAITSIYKILVCARCYLDTSVRVCHKTTKNPESNVKFLPDSKVAECQRQDPRPELSILTSALHDNLPLKRNVCVQTYLPVNTVIF